MKGENGELPSVTPEFQRVIDEELAKVYTPTMAATTDEYREMDAERRLAEIAQIIERRHCDPSIANAPSLRDFSGGIPENETERIYQLAKGTE